MTREEAVEELKHLEYYNRPFDNSAESCIRSEKGNEAILMAIKALEQEPSKWMAPDVLNKLIGAEVLDKIRVEIEALNEKVSFDYKMCVDKSAVLQIIDKYRPESEVSDANSN